MMNISIDISGKLELPVLEVIERVQLVCTDQGIEVFLVGALARDIHFLYDQGIFPGRATSDIDFALLVSNWDEFNRVKQQLV